MTLTQTDIDLLSDIVVYAWEAGAISDRTHDEALGLLQGELHGEA